MTTPQPYPTRASIHALFHNMETGNAAEVFKRVSPDVDWTVMGTHPCAGRYTSLKAFQEATFTRLGAIMKPPGLQLKVRNVIGGGEQEWATVELVAVAECESGEFFLGGNVSLHLTHVIPIWKILLLWCDGVDC